MKTIGVTSPVKLRDGRSIFFNNEKIIRALASLPTGVVLPNLEKYKFQLDPEQKDDVAEQAKKTAYDYVGDATATVDSLLEERPPKMPVSTKDMNDLNVLKRFFEDLHYRLLERKRFVLRGLRVQLPEVYNTTFSMDYYNSWVVKEIEQVFIKAF